MQTSSDKEPTIKSLQRATKEERPKIRKTLPELYCSVDMEKNITQCNDDYAERLGYDPSEIIGTLLLSYILPAYHDSVSSSFEICKVTGTATNKKIKMITKNGEVFEVRMMAKNMFDDGGTLIGDTMIFRDFTEIKTLQKTVKLRKYESLYEESPDLYRTVNYQGIIIDCNKSYTNKMGYTKDEILGVNLIDHTAERSKSEIRINMASWRNTGKGKTTTIWMIKKDGTEFPARLTPTNLFDDDGYLIGRNVVIQDTTELHDTRQVLNEREEVDRLKEEFLSAVTHELKSPLTPIIGHAQLLSNTKMMGALNEKQSNAVKAILSNATRLRKQVGDLLDAHKLDLGKMHFDYKEFSVKELLDGIMLSFEHTVKEKNVTIQLADMDGDYTMYSDNDRIEQVITNLIYNAVDFIPKDTGTITISADKVSDSVKFAVKDNGIGIPKDKQEGLFAKFYQTNTGVLRKHGGSGLGLSICKGIVDSLGGTISVNSVENEGSEFYFVIPIKRNDTE